MPCRRDAFGFVWWGAVSIALIGGCATTAKREPPPRLNGPIDNTPPLAISRPPDTTARAAQPEEQLAPPPGNPTPPMTATNPDPIDRLYRDALQACSRQSSYICRLRRRECANGKQKPEELMIFKCRARPFSVHFKWLGDEGKGREVIYDAGKDDKLHILTAAGDIPLTPAGRRLDLPRESLLVKSASKYPITEAGICAAIRRFGRQIDEFRRGQPGLTIKHVGSVSRPEYPMPLDRVELVFPPNHEPEIPQGGKRLLFFDPTTKWPVISTTMDNAGREVDYFCYDRFQLNVNLDDDDFNADKMWPIKQK